MGGHLIDFHRDCVRKLLQVTILKVCLDSVHHERSVDDFERVRVHGSLDIHVGQGGRQLDVVDIFGHQRNIRVSEAGIGNIVAVIMTDFVVVSVNLDSLARLVRDILGLFNLG